jgi:peptide/nickel transport system substrate-binding protein
MNDGHATVGNPRRVAAALALAGLVVVSVTACGEPAGTGAARSTDRVDSPGSTTDVVRPSGTAPRSGGRLIVGLDAESRGFDPTSSQLSASGVTVSQSIFDPHVMIGTDRQPHPYLAESLSPSNDARTWDIRLRSGIRFHDGTALDSAALKTFLEKARGSVLAGQALRPLRSVETLDPLTVRVEMDQPWMTFPFMLSRPTGFVAAPSQLANPDGARHPVGTGPFRFTSWEPDRSLVVERNPDYWRKDAVHLDAIEFRPVPDTEARIRSLRAGDIDVMLTAREPTVRDLMQDARAGRLQTVQAGGDQPVNQLMLNTSKPPFDDIRLRQAVAYAMDRDQIIALDESAPDFAADSPFSRSSPWYVDPHFPPHDQARAMQLVQQIEAEKGPVNVVLDTLPDPDSQKVVTVIQALLQDAGIHTDVHTTEQASLVNNVVTGDYQFATWRQFGGADPDLNYLWWHSAPAGSGMSLDMARNNDPEIDAALDEGRSSADPAAHTERSRHDSPSTCRTSG